MVEMKAEKRFRLPQEKGWRWIDPGETYTVASAKDAEFHEETGRGKRSHVPAKPSKKED